MYFYDYLIITKYCSTFVPCFSVFVFFLYPVYYRNMIDAYRLLLLK